MNPEYRSNAFGNARLFRMISYVLVFLLMGCTILTFSILIRGVFPEWHSVIIAGIALFVVIDRLYTYRQLKSMTFLSTE